MVCMETLEADRAERIRKIKRANFIAEVGFAAPLPPSMICCFCIILIDSAELGGPWSYVLGGLISISLLAGVFGISVAMAAEKEGIRHLPNLGDYIHGHDKNEER